jgi:F420-0:gamma-glutamyl ligase
VADTLPYETASLRRVPCARSSDAQEDPKEDTVARLNVEAVAEDTVAAPENKEPCYICVSVTNGHGLPVTGLDSSNILPSAMIVAPGGADIDVADVREYGTDSGFYYVDVIPTRDYVWKPGVYIFAIIVVAGADHGQTLTSVLLD